MSGEEQNLYYTILTDYGLKAIKEASFEDSKITITHLAIGDGAGAAYEPKADMSILKNEVYRGVVEQIEIDPQNPTRMSFECIIPPSSGGYTIREAGLFDEDGKLFAIAKLADTIKPKITQGATKELKVKLILELSHASAVNLTIDPSFVLASQKWINESFVPLNHLDDVNNPHKVTIAQALAAGNQKEYDYRVPKGGIIMWSGATNQIPTGWTLCNGQNGTPDLRNRFVIGAGGAYAVGATGGAVDKTTTTAGNHSHSFSHTTSSNGNHAHSFSQTTSSNGSHTHVVKFWSNNHTLSEGQVPAHWHKLFTNDGYGTGATDTLTNSNAWPTGEIDGSKTLSQKQNMLSSGGSSAHRHLLDGKTHDTGAHTHTVSGNTNNTGAHTHSVSGNTNTTGNHSHKVNVLPPYYALAFIMKL